MLPVIIIRISAPDGDTKVLFPAQEHPGIMHTHKTCQAALWLHLKCIFLCFFTNSNFQNQYESYKILQIRTPSPGVP